MSFLVTDEKRLSKPICIREFIQSYKPLFHLMPENPFLKDKDSRKSDILKMMNVDIDEDYLEKLMKHCNPSEENNVLNVNSNLNLFLVNKKYKCKKITTEALKFKTIEKLKERLKNDPKYTYKKMVKSFSDTSHEQNYRAPFEVHDLVPGDDTVINIRVYNRSVNPQKNGSKYSFNHDVVVAGSQKLSVLRDKIICPNDFRTLYDMSENPSLKTLSFAKTVFKSGCFFIEDTFYNDLRDPTNTDYSENIINWASENSDSTKYKKAVMENITFNDLTVRLGYPQLYRHHGNCDHIFIFSDIRILLPSDVCFSAAYPYNRSFYLKKTLRCFMCGSYVAKWIVEGCDRIPFDPAYFCETCFISYNYIDGKKIGNFKAYPYFDRNLVS